MQTVDWHYLSVESVPDKAWKALSAGQKNLHLLWTKKFRPLLDDYGRIRSTDLYGIDRAKIRRLLDAIAERRLLFGAQRSYRTPEGITVRIRSAEARMGAERLTVRLEVAEPNSPEEATDCPSITLRAEGAATDVAVVLEWRPQPEAGRGTVVLYPQATASQHRFGIAAFNRVQFSAIAAALLDYVDGTPALAAAS